MNYICRNNCHASDHSGRCPRCGEWLQSTSMNQEEIVKEVSDRQKQAWKDLKGEEFERIPSLTRERMRLNDEEKRYFNRLRKQNG